MDLKIEREAHGQDKMDWLRNWSEVTGSNRPVTVLLADFVQATHYPEYYITPGLLIGQYTATPQFWGPWDPGAGDGREVARGAIFSGFQVKRNLDGNTIATQIAGAALIEKANVQVILSKLPAGITGIPTAADLPDNWLAVPA